MTDTKQDVKELANDYLELCKNAKYSLTVKKNGKTIQIKGYKTFDIMEKASYTQSNFKGVLFTKDNNYVIAYLGTDFKNVKDIYADVKMGFNGTPRQFKDAVEFAQDIVRNHNLSPSDITVIGNSEGGSEAIHVKATLGLKAAYTFNPYVPNKNNYPIENLNNIYNFRTSKDIVSKAGDKIGEDFIVELKDGFTPHKDPMRMVADYHRIDNIGDCKNAVPVDEYKKTHRFIDKIRTDSISKRDIAEIPPEFYAVVEKDIDFAIRNIGLAENAETQGCVGSYTVSGYTREDGTKVKGYTRKCGASHADL